MKLLKIIIFCTLLSISIEDIASAKATTKSTNKVNLNAYTKQITGYGFKLNKAESTAESLEFNKTTTSAKFGEVAISRIYINIIDKNLVRIVVAIIPFDGFQKAIKSGDNDLVTEINALQMAPIVCLQSIPQIRISNDELKQIIAKEREYFENPTKKYFSTVGKHKIASPGIETGWQYIVETDIQN